MKKYAFSILTLLFITSSSFAQTDCSILRHSKLKYLTGDDLYAYIIIDGDKHSEFVQDGKFYIKSDLKWLGECEYEMTMTKITMPNFPFGPGEKMFVKIDKIEDDFVYVTGTVRGKSFSSRYKLIK